MPNTYYIPVVSFLLSSCVCMTVLSIDVHLYACVVAIAFLRVTTPTTTWTEPKSDGSKKQEGQVKESW